MDCRELELTRWRFALGEDRDCLAKGEEVSIPHTWSVQDANEAYIGTGWYQTRIPPAREGETRAFLTFRGAYRDVEIDVNGHKICGHSGSGYTPFTREITEALAPDGSGVITVKVNNCFSREALPFDRSFDWAPDGGLFRPVTLRRTGDMYLDRPVITARPILREGTGGRRADSGPAAFSFAAPTDPPAVGITSFRMTWELLRSGRLIAGGELPVGGELPLTILPEADYWHFDRPRLYTLRLTLLDEADRVSDQQETRFGFRELKACGDELVFNGESVRLPGMEWMPGSDPDVGAAETPAELERMLRLLKESNTVLTRFHWQQDEYVLDWCDAHGILVQEELPYWGKQPEGDPEALWPVVCLQLEEMIEAHRHHPCIVAWGVGNELSAFTEKTRLYIRRAVAEARWLDPTRMVNYVTNTAFPHPFEDGTAEGDVLMINDYIGTWHQGFDQESAWKALVDAHPGRVFIPSEFGLCEPAFSGGDAERERIFLSKLRSYRNIPAIGGTIYFCLNDYRTHMGEDGSSRHRRRVHGSADWKGKPKPSYDTVRREYSPLVLETDAEGLLVRVRDDIPRYEARGYLLTDGERTVPIPGLHPSERSTWRCPPDIRPNQAAILRPTGEIAYKLQEDNHENDGDLR